MHGFARRIMVMRIGTFLVCTLGCVQSQTHELQPPNILLIVSEDHGPHLGCYGDLSVSTPSLDSLAAQGIRFTNAYVTQAGCSPSRSSILTGLYPHQNGQIGLATHRYTMYREWPNIPSILKEAGYRTGIIGKLHVNPESAFPFDSNWSDRAVSGFDDRNVERVAMLADSFITASADPFFLMVNFPDAHVPYLRQQRGIPQVPISEKDVIPFPSLGIDTELSRRTVANYYSCIKRLDVGIGMIVDVLREHKMLHNTCVIFLSDHGPQLARGKMTSYEFGTKIPLIMHWPARIEKGKIADELVSTIDLLPTIIEAAGIQFHGALPGRSLLPLTDNRENVNHWRKYLFTEYTVHFPHVYFPQRTIRDRRYKLIVNYLQDRANPLMERYLFYGRDITRESIGQSSAQIREVYRRFEHPPPVELYDLSKDPEEFFDLSGNPKYAAILRRLRGQLIEWQNNTNDPLLDEKKLKKLTAEHDQLTKGTDDAWIVQKREYTWKYPQYLTTFEQ